MNWENVITGGLGIGNIASTLYTNRVNRQQQERQNRWNLNLWNMNNAYNSPLSQMNRLIAAGLNPDMMYGGSNAGLGMSSSPSSSQSPMPYNAPQVDPLMALQMEQANANIDKTKAEADLIRSQKDGQNYQNLGLRLNGEYAKIYLEAFEKASPKDMESMINHAVATIKNEFKNDYRKGVLYGEQITNGFWNAASELYAMYFKFFGGYEINKDGEYILKNLPNIVVNPTGSDIPFGIKLPEGIEEGVEYSLSGALTFMQHELSHNGIINGVDVAKHYIASVIAGARAANASSYINEMRGDYQKWINTGEPFKVMGIEISPKTLQLIQPFISEILDVGTDVVGTVISSKSKGKGKGGITINNNVPTGKPGTGKKN